MKQLIALAAVLGLAVSSWGLTPQAQVAPRATAAVVPEAQLGSYLAPRVWSYGKQWGMHRYTTFDNFNAGMQGGFAGLGGILGGIAGGPLGTFGVIIFGTFGAALGGY